MKIYLYRHTEELRDDTQPTPPPCPPLTQILQAIQKLSLADREREVGGKVMVLESVPSTPGSLVEMDFILRRLSNGPGLSAVGQPVADFELPAQAGFGEQTAVCYAPNSNLVAVQFHQSGPRVGGIQDYLNGFLLAHPAGRHYRYAWTPVLREDVMAELARSPRQTKLVVGIDSRGLTEQDVKANVSLNTALRLRQEVNAGMVNMTLNLAARKGSLTNVMDFVRGLAGRPEVKTLRATVRDLDEQDTTLDLLEARVSAEVDAKTLRLTEGLRYDFPSRIKALKQEMDAWQRSF